MLVDGDREEAADRVGVHHGDQVDRAALAEELDGLRERGRVHLLVAVELAPEADHGRVLLADAGECAVVAHRVDHFLLDAGFHGARLVPVPFEVVVRLAARDEDRELAHVGIERALADGSIVQVVERVGDVRVVRGEGERSAQGSLGALTGQRLVDLLARLVHVLALQIGQARERIRIDVGRKLRSGLCERRERARCGQEQRGGQDQRVASEHAFSPSFLFVESASSRGFAAAGPLSSRR